MNNTTTIALAAIVVILMSATLVGTTSTKSSTAAFVYKKDNGKGNGNGNTVTIEECKNKGSASGFDTAVNQECENLICNHPGENATCTQEGAAAAVSAAVAAAKRTCEQCFTTFLNPDQITGVLNGRTPESACPVFRGGLVLSESDFRNALGDARVDPTIANELITCLRDAGVVFGP
jgi:hypothetical protein